MSARLMFVVTGLLLAACGVAGDDTGSDETTSTSTSSPTTSTTTETKPTSENQMNEEEVVQEAIRDLAARLDVPQADIEVVEVREVQWPDGALGCPEEGKMYTQAVVDGTQVLLGANERIYDYHAGSDGAPFLCPSDEKDGGYEFLPPPGMP
ncbi:MAG TPA: hypothetical protein VF148_06915 [Acidimicrobiia bacterium]